MEFYKVKLQMVREKKANYNSLKIRSTKDIVKYIDTIENYNSSAQETAAVVCLNNKNQVISYVEISKGNSNSCFVDIPELFKSILISNANKFILLHNHPSGDSTPSSADIIMTEKIKEAAEIMRINFLDHIVIGENEHTSIFEFLMRKENKGGI